MKANISSIGISAMFLLALPAQAITIIDNDDAGFTDHLGNVYEQTPSIRSDAFNGTVILSNFAQAAPNTYLSWTFTGLDTSKTYDVAATWNLIFPPGNHAAAASYKILGSTTLDVTVSHQANATGDYVEADDDDIDFNFQTLGQVMPDNTGTIILELRDEDGNGIQSPVADAVLVNAVPEPSSALLLTAGGLLAFFRRKR